MEYLSKIIGNENVTHFYSSEEYGAAVAKYMNIVDRRVDSNRQVIPIRATDLRRNIDKNKKWLDEEVYLDYKNNNLNV